jgi:hypothetical protein
MKVPSKKEILYWVKRYNKEEDSGEFKSLERKLGKKLRKTKRLTKPELKKIVAWKFQANLLGRRKRTFNLLKSSSNLKIGEVTKEALEHRDDSSRVEILTHIKGIGPALASCILSFYDPKNYGVKDIHIERELFGRDLHGNIKDYLKLLSKLRMLSKKYNLPVRTIEKALFKKNLEEE